MKERWFNRFYLVALTFFALSGHAYAFTPSTGDVVDGYLTTERATLDSCVTSVPPSGGGYYWLQPPGTSNWTGPSASGSGGFCGSVVSNQNRQQIGSGFYWENASNNAYSDWTRVGTYTVKYCGFVGGTSPSCTALSDESFVLTDSTPPPPPDYPAWMPEPGPLTAAVGASVQLTGTSIWQMLPFLGIPIAFVIAIWVIELIRFMNKRKTGYYEQDGPGSSKLHRAKDQERARHIHDIQTRGMTEF